jgi:biopolymer transport protein ExbD
MGARKRRRRRRLLSWDTEESINLTPLLDVIFNLIFFFLLATTIKQSQAFLDVKLPKSSRANIVKKEKKIIVITLDKENRIFFEKDEVSIDDLEKKLIETSPEEVDRIVLRGDAKSYHESVVNILDVCVKAGHRGVSVEVKKEDK